MSRTVRLDLREYTSPGVAVFVGRDRGQAVRKDAGIRAGDHVEITVPDPCYCLHFGFVWELLRGCTATVVNNEYQHGAVQESLAEQKRFESLGPFRPVPQEKCPDALLPDGPVCPLCGGRRGPSGADRGSWVHY